MTRTSDCIVNISFIAWKTRSDEKMEQIDNYSWSQHRSAFSMISKRWYIYIFTWWSIWCSCRSFLPFVDRYLSWRCTMTRASTSSITHRCSFRAYHDERRMIFWIGHDMTEVSTSALCQDYEKESKQQRSRRESRRSRRNNRRETGRETGSSISHLFDQSLIDTHIAWNDDMSWMSRVLRDDDRILWERRRRSRR